MAVKAIPQGFHSVTPYLTVNDAARALEFYKRAFGAQEIMRMASPDGKVGHAEIKIGDSMIMIADEMPGAANKSPQTLNGTTAGVLLYVENADKLFNQAVGAGAHVEEALADMYWGDRYGRVKDPFGHSWSVATHKEDVAPAELSKRMEEHMAKQGQQARTAH